MKNYPINFAIEGRGKDYILFLHGWGGDKRSFQLYKENLKQEFKTITLDLYGFGQSKMPKPFFCIYEYALQIYLFLKNKNISEIIIISHSFGGRIALILGSCFDIKIKKNILISSAGILPKRNIKYYFKVYSFKLKKILAKRFKFIKLNHKKIGSSDYQNLQEDMRKTFVKIVNQNLKYLLKNVKCKTLLIWGKKDKVTPLYMSKIMYKHIADSKLYVIKKGGHFCFLTNFTICFNIINSTLYDIRYTYSDIL